MMIIYSLKEATALCQAQHNSTDIVSINAGGDYVAPKELELAALFHKIKVLKPELGKSVKVSRIVMLREHFKSSGIHITLTDAKNTIECLFE